MTDPPTFLVHHELRAHLARTSPSICVIPAPLPLHTPLSTVGLRTVPYKRDVRYGMYGSRYRTVGAPNGHSNGRSRIQLDKNGCKPSVYGHTAQWLT
jgi:hypothetical protein